MDNKWDGKIMKNERNRWYEIIETILINNIQDDAGNVGIIKKSEWSFKFESVFPVNHEDNYFIMTPE